MISVRLASSIVCVGDSGRQEDGEVEENDEVKSELEMKRRSEWDANKENEYSPAGIIVKSMSTRVSNMYALWYFVLSRHCRR